MLATLPVLLLLFAPCHALLAGVKTPGRWLCSRKHSHLRPKMAVLPPYNSGITPIEIQIIQRQFASVRELPRVSQSFKGNETDNTMHDNTWWWSRTQEVDDYIEPTFRRLFTHQTWERYTGGSALGRLGRLVVNWRFDAVLSRVWPVLGAVFSWSYLIARLLPTSTIAKVAGGLGTALQMQGTAIAFLLVFRTDNAYRRLNEAREAWGHIIYLCRELVIKSVVALEYDAVCDVSRYLCAYSWTLRDKLRTSSKRDDILEVLLEESECRWVSDQRSRPIALLNRVRQVTCTASCSAALSLSRTLTPTPTRALALALALALTLTPDPEQVMHRELQRGALTPTLHYSIDMDLAKVSC